jgi:hypothetical protein
VLQHPAWHLARYSVVLGVLRSPPTEPFPLESPKSLLLLVASGTLLSTHILLVLVVAYY